MKNSNTRRLIPLLALPLGLLALPGCSGQPPATTSDNQAAKEQEAKKKMMGAIETDPRLQRPGSNPSPPSSAPPSPGPVPGGSGQ